MNLNNYLVSFKKSIEGKPFRQTILSSTEVLNMISTTYSTLMSLDETSSNLRALSDLNKIDNGSPKLYENTENGACLHFQKRG